MKYSCLQVPGLNVKSYPRKELSFESLKRVDAYRCRFCLWKKYNPLLDLEVKSCIFLQEVEKGDAIIPPPFTHLLSPTLILLPQPRVLLRRLLQILSWLEFLLQDIRLLIATNLLAAVTATSWFQQQMIHEGIVLLYWWVYRAVYKQMLSIEECSWDPIQGVSAEVLRV